MTEPPQSSESAPAAPDRPRGRVRGWLWVLLFAAIAAGGFYFYDRQQSLQLAEKKAADTKKGFGKGTRGPIPVVAVPARQGRIDVYLDGLGTVTPLGTVTVRSRVEGQLMRVHFEEGEVVQQGQLLAEIDPRPFEVMLKQAEGQLARDQALLANARIDAERYRTLLAQDSIAKQQVDAQEALVRQYEGVVISDQSQVDSARLQLSYARITSPLTGRAGLRLLDPGNIVRPGDSTGLVVITQLTPIGVVFTVPQDHLPALMKRVQSQDRLAVEAWDREQKNQLAQGTLLAIDNLVDVATGTVKLKARFRNDGNELFPNQFVNVRLRLDRLDDQTVISQSAVQRGGRGLFVYVVKDDMTVTARPVVLGPADGPRVSVMKGIEPGERVVIDGVDRLREGTRVSLAKRPDFKPSIDGSSGARKHGKSKGAKGGAAAGGEGGQAGEGRRQASGSSTGENAAPASGSSGEEVPRKRERTSKPGTEGTDAAPPRFAPH
jgi:membrane fusion protein, multidrug efflux system